MLTLASNAKKESLEHNEELNLHTRVSAILCLFLFLRSSFVDAFNLSWSDEDERRTNTALTSVYSNRLFRFKTRRRNIVRVSMNGTYFLLIFISVFFFFPFTSTVVICIIAKHLRQLVHLHFHVFPLFISASLKPERNHSWNVSEISIAKTNSSQTKFPDEWFTQFSPIVSQNFASSLTSFHWTAVLCHVSHSFELTTFIRNYSIAFRIFRLI